MALITLHATIYDGNPNECGPCAWPQFTDVAYRGRSVMNITKRVKADAARQARDCGQYDADDTIWYQIADEDGRIVAGGEF